MPRSHYPPPIYSPLQRVAVVGEPPPLANEGGVLGEHGIIVWPTAYFVEKSHFGATGWLYVIHFLREDTYARIQESRLVPVGEEAPLASCLGRDFEISYDRDGSGPDAIGGTFRVPGGFWNTFVFRNAAVAEIAYEIRIPVRFHLGGIAKYNFTVPQTILLDSEYIESVMSVIFDAEKWRPITGPLFSWFY